MFSYDGIAIASILGTSLDAVFTIDARGIIVDANAAASTMFGWSKEELLGANISLIVPSPIKERHDGFLKAFSPDRGVKHVLGRGQRLDGQRKDGTHFPVEVGISAFVQQGQRFFTGFVRDMSERQRSADRMQYLATHDMASGFLNHRGFAEKCNQSTDGLARIIVFRIEEFRRFSIIYGEQWSLSTVQELAERVGQFLGAAEVVARVREDTFAILLPEYAEERVSALAKILGQPFAQGKMRFPLTTTFGISQRLGKFEQLLRTAQWACDRACASGKGGINEFTDEFHHSSRRQLQIETRLRDVVGNNELSLVLQPKIRLSDQRIMGAEALVRWLDPALGVIPPSEFIPIAERHGLIGGITDWVLHQALTEVSRCVDPSISVAVNFSALDFFQPDLVSRTHMALEQSNVAPANLVVELTESVAAQDVSLVNSKLRELKGLGVGISLDDFGTGYSSLSYLRQFPIDSLKIDIAFVRDLPESKDALAIATAIVSMAGALGMSTIAEGIEKTGQAEVLKSLGVDLCQGFLYSRPLPPAEFHRLIQAQCR